MGLVCESSPGYPSQKPRLKQTRGGAGPPGPRSESRLSLPAPLPSPRVPYACCFRPALEVGASPCEWGHLCLSVLLPICPDPSSC